MEFITQGQKIKRMRSFLNMKQKDFEDVGITRAYISMIEIDKRSLNKETALPLLTKFQERANQIGVPLEIDLEYLLNAESDDAKGFCTLKLQDSDCTEIDEVIKVANKYNFNDVLAESYYRFAEKDYSLKDYVQASINYTKALDYYNKIGKDDVIPYLYNRLGHCKMNQLQLLEALNYLHISNNYASNQKNNDIYAKSTYNIALCYKKLNMFDLSLDYLNSFFSIDQIETNINLYVYARILKSSCFEAKNMLDDAIEELQSLSNAFKDTDNVMLGYIYNNLGTLFLKQDNYEKSIEFFKKAQEIRQSKDIGNLGFTLIEKSCVYLKTAEYEKAHNLLKQGIEQAAISNDLECLMKGLIILGDSYFELKMFDEAEQLYLNAPKELLDGERDNYRLDAINVYTKLSLIYLEKGDFGNLKIILEKIINLS